MPKPLSIDLRKRVMDAIDKGMTQVEAAKVFKVVRRSIRNWINLIKETGSLQPKTGYQKGHSPKITEWDEFKAFVDENKFSTIEEMKEKWSKLKNVTISKNVIARGLKKINYTFKKKLLVSKRLMLKNVKNI